MDNIDTLKIENMDNIGILKSYKNWEKQFTDLQLGRTS